MRKQITSLLLTLAMLLSLVPTLGVTASAAEDDTSYSQAEIRDYATFASYLRSYDSRDLKLMEDIDYTVGINDLSIDVMCNQKLDLNGHKIRIDASKRAGFENLLCIRRGEFTLYDSKGGGELAVSFPDDDKAYSIIMMMLYALSSSGKETASSPPPLLSYSVNSPRRMQSRFSNPARLLASILILWPFRSSFWLHITSIERSLMPTV